MSNILGTPDPSGCAVHRMVDVGSGLAGNGSGLGIQDTRDKCAAFLSPYRFC